MSDNEPTDTQKAEQEAAAAKAAAEATAKQAEGGDNGFPANTPLEQMNAGQREAYWKHQAKKHESRNKALDRITPDDLKSLREKAAKAEAHERELMSDKDKAIADAKQAAEAEATAKYRPLLVRARIEAAAAGRVEADRLSTLLDPLDMSKFLTDSGDVDADKVSAYVNGIAPAKGSTSHGPGLPGSNFRPSDVKPAVSAGQDLWDRRHPNRSSN